MRLLALVGALLALAFTACGGGGSGPTATRPAVATEHAGGAKDATAKTVPRRSRPTVRMSKAEISKLPPLAIPRPSGPPPHRLQVIDLRSGTGPGAARTDVVTLRYMEDTYPEARSGRQGGLSGGEIGPASYRLDQPPFRSFRRDLPGMKVGGRRELIVPPKAAYPRWKPSWGYAPYVSIYVVDLLGVEPQG